MRLHSLLAATLANSEVFARFRRATGRLLLLGQPELVYRIALTPIPNWRPLRENSSLTPIPPPALHLGGRRHAVTLRASPAFQQPNQLGTQALAALSGNTVESKK